MKTFLEYVDEAQKKLGMESDAAFSKHLGGGDNRTLVSNWRNKGITPEDYYCIKIAQILEIDPMEVIAASNHARAKDEEKKSWWENFRKQHVKNVVGVLLAIVCAIGYTGATANPDRTALAVFALIQVRIMCFCVKLTSRFKLVSRKTGFIPVF